MWFLSYSDYWHVYINRSFIKGVWLMPAWPFPIGQGATCALASCSSFTQQTCLSGALGTVVGEHNDVLTNWWDRQFLFSHDVQTQTIFVNYAPNMLVWSTTMLRMWTIWQFMLDWQHGHLGAITNFFMHFWTCRLLGNRYVVCSSYLGWHSICHLSFIDFFAR